MTLLPDLSPATVMVCGVQAPSMGRRPQPAEDAAPDAPAPEPVPEPLAREAKHFTEVDGPANPLWSLKVVHALHDRCFCICCSEDCTVVLTVYLRWEKHCSAIAACCDIQLDRLS